MFLHHLHRARAASPAAYAPQLPPWLPYQRQSSGAPPVHEITICITSKDGKLVLVKFDKLLACRSDGIWFQQSSFVTLPDEEVNKLSTLLFHLGSSN